MQCLHAGYRASNVPVGGQAALSAISSDNSQTESGRNAIIEVSAVAEKYGQRPSTLMKGDPFDLQLDLMTARTHWQYQAEEREKSKAKG